MSLHYASIHGFENVVKALLDGDANIEAKMSCLGMTALHQSALKVINKLSANYSREGLMLLHDKSLNGVHWTCMLSQRESNRSMLPWTASTTQSILIPMGALMTKLEKRYGACEELANHHKAASRPNEGSGYSYAHDPTGVLI